MASILEKKFDDFATVARSGKFNKTPYALSLAHGVWQAIACGYKKITAIELGVAGGNGLRDLCVISDYLEKEFEIQIEVIGFDTGVGLPELHDYRDHPEIWHQGEFSMGNSIDNLPNRAQLILGNVQDTIPLFASEFKDIIGFVSIDLDLYSSTVSAMPLFEMPAKRYLPATPIYVDDINVSITYNPWCGESLALREFNDSHELRKFEEKSYIWRIPNFHVLHILDHPIRNGVEKPLHPLTMQPF